MLEEIYNYLCEWANNTGNRAKMLVNFVVSNNGELSDDQLNDVFKCFLSDNGIIGKINEDIALKPDLFGNNDDIMLLKLYNIKGVNKLDSSQELIFSKNLTVIYGKNATGKTGYSRILKSLGNSFDVNSLILGDVFNNKKISQSCDINYIKKGLDETKSITWNGDGTANLPICVFNSSCVNVGINNRKLTFSPYGFHLFDIIKGEIERLNSLLENKISGIETEIENLLSFKIKMKSDKFIKFIDGISYETDLDIIEQFVDKNKLKLDKEKKKLIKEKSSYNVNFIRIRNEVLGNQLGELNTIERIIDQYKTVFSLEKRKKYVNNKKELSKLNNSPRLTISEIAKEKGVIFYNSNEFIKFIEIADLYFTKMNDSSNSICPYCLQELSSDANDLLMLYNKAIHNTIQEKINSLSDEITVYERDINSLEDFKKTNYSTFGKDKKGNDIMPNQISNIFSLKTEYINNSENIDYINESLFKIGKSYIDTIKKELISQKSNDNVTEIEEKEKNIQNKIDEVEDSIIYLGEKKSLNKYIELLLLKEKLSALKSEFHGNKFSGVVQRAKDKLITDKYNVLFENERKLLQCPENIDYKLRVQEGKTKIDQSICNNKLENILSEGEQKSIALAEFITELQITGNDNPIIFDDPVNSLDYERLGVVAERLFNLSKERQIIVFTHNIFLFNTFEQLYDGYDNNGDFEYTPYYIEKKDNKTGYLYKNIPLADMNYKKYRKKINELLNNSPKDKPNDEIVQEGYNYLRALIELLIEEKIFCGIVKRLHPEVKTTMFGDVKGDLIIKYQNEIMRIYNKSCRYVKGHSNPPGSVSIPEIKEFKSDFKLIEEIGDNFNG